MDWAGAWLWILDSCLRVSVPCWQRERMKSCFILGSCEQRLRQCPAAERRAWPGIPLLVAVTPVTTSEPASLLERGMTMLPTSPGCAQGQNDNGEVK